MRIFKEEKEVKIINTIETIKTMLIEFWESDLTQSVLRKVGESIVSFVKGHMMLTVFLLNAIFWILQVAPRQLFVLLLTGIPLAGAIAGYLMMFRYGVKPCWNFVKKHVNAFRVAHPKAFTAAAITLAVAAIFNPATIANAAWLFFIAFCISTGIAIVVKAAKGN